MKALIASAIFVMICTGCVPNYSEGIRAGTITKLSHKGLVFKSWEGSILQGGMVEHTDDKGNVSMVANILDFSVIDDKIVAKLNRAMASGNTVKITYTQWLIPPITVESPYIIVSVEE